MTLNGPEKFRALESHLEHNGVLSAQRKPIKQAFEITGLQAGSTTCAPTRASRTSCAA